MRKQKVNLSKEMAEYINTKQCKVKGCKNKANLMFHAEPLCYEHADGMKFYRQGYYNGSPIISQKPY